MATDKQIVTIADFAGGEAGTRHGLETAPKNSFTGRNVMVYRDGAIGPRAGLLDMTPTGQSNGKIHAMGFTGIPGNEVWYAQGTAVYQFGTARSSAYTGSLAGTPTKASAVFGDKYLLVPGDKLYKLDHTAKTVTAVSASPDGRCVAGFGSRVFIADQPSFPNRIRYSADADDTDWVVTAATGAPGQFDVGLSSPLPAEEIRGLYPFRDFLLIVKGSGEMWVLTTNGDPTTTGTLRRVSVRESGGAIFQSQRGGMTYGNEYWAVGMHSTAPQTYTGGRLRELAYLGSENAGEFTETGPWSLSMLQTDTNPPEYTTIGLSQDSVLMVGGNAAPRGLLRRNGIWTKHEFGVTVVGYAADGNVGGAYLTDGGGSLAVPHFYWWNTADEQPPIKGAGIKLRDSIGDGSDTAPACDVTTPLWRDAQGRRSQVRTVTVSFRKYATGVSATNHFDLAVAGEYGLDNSTEASTAVQSFDEAAASGTATGKRAQVRFGFGDQTYHGGFQLVFTNLRGVSIDKVQVEVLTEPVLS